MKIYAIDFDATAKLFPEKVNFLYENKNNFIIIHTARSSAIRDLTEKELKTIGIKYHALVMDKIRADVFIDDRNEGGLKWPEDVF